ncbi:MAG: heavy metal-responsive transcriptional regulator [Snowella sp.]|nr:heavy metal-responsive transcriptional regulator [Snowella sp.]
MPTLTLLKIGDIAKQTGVSVGTLRYYENLKLLYPLERGENGYRYFGVQTIQQVQFIKKAQSLGFSLEEIRQILDVRDRGELPCNLVQELLDHKIEQLETQLQQITMFKSELEEYREHWSKVPNSKRENNEICPLIATVPLKSH